MITLENTISTTPTAGARRNGAPQAGRGIPRPECGMRHERTPQAGWRHWAPQASFRHWAPQNSSRRF